MNDDMKDFPRDEAPPTSSGFFKRLTQNPLENTPHRVRQRTVVSLLILGIVTLLGAGLFLEFDNKTQSKKDDSSETNLTLHPGQAQREAYGLKSEMRLDEMASKIDRVERSLRELADRQAQFSLSLTSEVKEHGETIAAIDRDRRILMENESRRQASQSAQETNARPQPNRWQAERLENASNAFRGMGEAGAVQPVTGYGGSPRLAIVTMTPPSDERATTRRPAVTPAPLIKPDDPIALNRAPGASVESYIPAGSFVRATLLTGVYASTGGAASAASAMPVLMRLDHPAILPNRWRSKVERCHVTGSATGDISSERTLIRLDRLSCVSSRGGTLDIRVSGYAVGADGKVGIRSRLVTRSGQAIAAALSTSLLSGLGRAVSLSTQSTTTNALTGSDTVRYDNALKAGLGTGLASGMDRLVSYYLDMAKNIFPVLEVDSGVHADLVFSQGTVLTDNL